MRASRIVRWLIAALLGGSLLGWTATGQLAYARLFYLGLVVLVVSALWAVLSLRGLQLSRSTRTLRASMGEVFEERYEITNQAWPGCLWLEILNESGLPMAAGSRLLTLIGHRQRRFYTARTLLSRRGAYRLGPTRMTTGDPFGLFTLTRSFPARETLVVLPMAFPIATFPPPPGLLPGGRTIRQRTADVTPHAAGVREYVPGDPMKRIHWPSTAHRERFMVKEFEQDPQADIWIFLDAQSSTHFQRPDEPVFLSQDGWWLRRPQVAVPRDSFEYGVSAAASLAQHFLADRRSVGLASNTRQPTVLSAERGVRQITKLMETLAFLQPDGGLPLLGLVTAQARLLQIGTGVILISSNTDPGLLLAVELLQRRNLRPVVVLIKPESFGGQGDSQQITSGLLGRNVPVCLVGMGEDLAARLALPVVYFQRPSSTGVHFSVAG